MIAGLVLAGGGATRMGRQKLLLPVGSEPLVRWSVRAILGAGLDEVVVVVGSEADAVESALAGLDVRTVRNPRFAEGQSTSLRAGLDALGPDVDGVVVALGDQPLPDPAVVRRLVAALRESTAHIVIPRYRDGRGHPVLFRAAVFPELRRVTGDAGGRAVVARDPARVLEVPVEGEIPPDVDTPEQYEALRRRLTPGA